MIRMLALAFRYALGSNRRRLVQQAVGVDHIVYNATLADFLALELPLCRKVTTIIIAEMVVRSDGEGFDASVNEEFCKDRLELRLARFQVVTTNEGLVPLSEFNNPRNKRVLWGTVDERLAFEDSGDGEESRRGYLRMRGLNSSEQIIRSVVYTSNDIAVPLCVGSPEDDDAIKFIVSLELAYIGANMFQVDLFILSRNEVISSRFLIGGNKVGIVDRWERLAEQSHVWCDLALEVVVENLSTVHSPVHGCAGDVPTPEDKIIGVDHG